MSRNIVKCVLCGKEYYHCARGLCTRCYPKVRLNGQLDKYPERRNKWKEIADDVVSKYLSGLTSLQIASEYNASDTTVRNILKKMNIPRRRTGYSKIYSLDEKIFDHLSNEGAYWLGFLYADGFVGQRKLSLHIHGKDKNHIMKLLKFLKSNSPIRRDSNKKYITLDVHSVYLTHQLESLGIVVGRGKFQKIKKVLNTLELKRNFIRGYLDGDGYIGKSPSIKFYGNKDVISWINKTLSIETGISQKKLFSDKSIFRITYNGKFQALKICRWIYANSKVHMERKYLKYINWDVL